MMARQAEKEIDYDAAMRLPDGKTCADCRHIKRCEGFGFSTKPETSCDFYPSRYSPPGKMAKAT